MVAILSSAPVRQLSYNKLEVAGTNHWYTDNVCSFSWQRYSWDRVQSQKQNKAANAEWQTAGTASW